MFSGNSGVDEGKDPDIAFGGVGRFEFYLGLGGAKALIGVVVAIKVGDERMIVPGEEVLTLGAAAQNQEHQQEAAVPHPQ